MVDMEAVGRLARFWGEAVDAARDDVLMALTALISWSFTTFPRGRLEPRARALAVRRLRAYEARVAELLSRTASLRAALEDEEVRPS